MTQRSPSILKLPTRNKYDPRQSKTFRLRIQSGCVGRYHDINQCELCYWLRSIGGGKIRLCNLGKCRDFFFTDRKQWIQHYAENHAELEGLKEDEFFNRLDWRRAEK